MGTDQVLTQSEAWNTYDECIVEGRTVLLEAPEEVELRFPSLSQEKRPAPKDWADFYLAAFAIEAGVRLVTFDQALHKKSPDAVLLT